jgi:hypothetical protein
MRTPNPAWLEARRHHTRTVGWDRAAVVNRRPSTEKAHMSAPAGHVCTEALHKGSGLFRFQIASPDWRPMRQNSPPGLKHRQRTSGSEKGRERQTSFHVGSRRLEGSNSTTSPAVATANAPEASQCADASPQSPRGLQHSARTLAGSWIVWCGSQPKLSTTTLHANARRVQGRSRQYEKAHGPSWFRLGCVQMSVAGCAGAKEGCEGCEGCECGDWFTAECEEKESRSDSSARCCEEVCASKRALDSCRIGGMPFAGADADGFGCC